MIRGFLLAVVGLWLLAVGAPAGAGETIVGTLHIAQPRLRLPPRGTPITAGYLTVTNKGTEPDRLLGATAAIAGKIEIHEMKMDGAMMHMRALAAGLPIASGETITLKPGSYHLMVMGLKAPLEAGRPVKITLLFEKAGAAEIEFAVEPIGSMGH
ncbi:MAG: copper chaperone PCu(A)C [Hyphomicrobiaceae bacterium]